MSTDSASMVADCLKPIYHVNQNNGRSILASCKASAMTESSSSLHKVF